MAGTIRIMCMGPGGGRAGAPLDESTDTTSSPPTALLGGLVPTLGGSAAGTFVRPAGRGAYWPCERAITRKSAGVSGLRPAVSAALSEQAAKSVTSAAQPSALSRRRARGSCCKVVGRVIIAGFVCTT
jgi:hypothetical protein